VQVEAVEGRKEEPERGALKSLKNPVHQYNHIEVFRDLQCSAVQCDLMQVGHKMNSYTITELLPSSDYNVLLCLKKNKHIIPVSRSGRSQSPDDAGR
jgi:hypothetical protein